MYEAKSSTKTVFFFSWLRRISSAPCRQSLSSTHVSGQRVVCVCFALSSYTSGLDREVQDLVEGQPPLPVASTHPLQSPFKNHTQQHKTQNPKHTHMGTRAKAAREGQTGHVKKTSDALAPFPLFWLKSRSFVAFCSLKDNGQGGARGTWPPSS